MALRAVFVLLLTTHTTIMTNNNTTLSRKNISTIIGGFVASNFGIYQENAVGLSKLSIRSLVTDPTNADPYHKALITKKIPSDPVFSRFSFHRTK